MARRFFKPSFALSIGGTCAQQTSEFFAIGDTEFGEDAVEVALHSARGDVEPVTDLAVGQARRNKCPDFALSVGDRERPFNGDERWCTEAALAGSPVGMRGGFKLFDAALCTSVLARCLGGGISAHRHCAQFLEAMSCGV